MSLVNYEDSDDSDSEHTHHNDQQLGAQTSGASVGQQISRIQTANELKGKPNINDSLFSSLPPPKTSSDANPRQRSLLNSSLSDSVSKKSGQTIKISVPSLKQYADDDEDSITAKRFKGSDGGTALLSLLPKPKSTSMRQLIPQSVSRPKLNTDLQPKHQKTVTFATIQPKIDSQTEDENNYFFIDHQSPDKNDDLNAINSYPESELNEKSVDIAPKLPEYKEPPNLAHTTTYASNASLNEQSTSGTQSTKNTFDDISYKKFIASKFGEESAEDINIIDVNVAEHLSQSNDWLKTISEEREEAYNGVMPTSTARRKHQITYLAFQAKQREVELKNQWAVNRQTKTQSRSKYGF